MKYSTHTVAAAVAIFLAAFPTVQAGPEKGANARNFPKVQLPEVSRGKKAVDSLGAQLPEVARAYGRRAADLRNELLQDEAMAVDQAGRLLFTDPAPEAGVIADTGATPSGAIPLEDTFRLHSRPGAKRIVYLDFDGHVMGGAWAANYNGGQPINAPAWDIDGLPGSFSNDERLRIQQIWQRVAEDFAPFDVDVTTELANEGQITRSSTSDEFYGTRVLISPISQYFGNYGGIAYVGVYDDVGDYYKPALVFSEKLGNSEKNIGEAASHEAGHNLGLSHDGVTGGSAYYSGHTVNSISWAPIMGVGYYSHLTQWSRGEYSNANSTQDDISVIQSFGMPLRADDVGNAAANAAFLPAGSQISTRATIERAVDIDVFGFTTGTGPIALQINPAEHGGNLDITADLRNANGALIASSNPVSALGASFNLDLPGGNYYLHIRGTGNGDAATGYSTYGSLGDYSISGTIVNSTGTVAPIANATSSTASTDAPSVVQFSGSTSFDQDGTIVSYDWNFGDGTTASGATATHSYATVGQFTATLTVTDNTGLTGSDTVVINVTAPNISPIANASATPVSGTAPLNVGFNATGSSDPDGTIASYHWNFGDGATGSGASVQHTYAVGNYTAVLTVTDNRGATATSSLVIVVSPAAVSVMRVEYVSMSAATSSAGRYARATVRMTDLSGSPVSGITVSGNFSGVVAGSVNGVTGVNGTVVLQSRKSRKGGAVTFTVTGASKSGWNYNPAQNLQNSGTITL